MNDKHCAKSCRGVSEQDKYFSASTILREEKTEIKQTCRVSARIGETVGEASNLAEGPKG